MSIIEQQIKKKIEQCGIPLKDWDIRIYRGILTGLNEAFIIDSTTRDTLVVADPKSAEIIRPILRGRDIKRYACTFAEQWLICTQTGSKDGLTPPVNVEQYPAIKTHLDQYYPALEKRLDKGITPYHLRSCAYMDDFSKQKIVWGEISDKPKFSIDANGEFASEATTFLMTGSSLYYLLGFLNSKVSQYFFAKIGTTTGVGTVRWKKFKIEELMVPPVSIVSEDCIIELVCQIFKALDSGCETIEFEHKINQAIYTAFELSPTEIAVIEDYCNNANT